MAENRDHRRRLTYQSVAPSIVVALLLILPIVAGIAVGTRWPNPSQNYYGTTSQLIATFFIAIVLEFLWRDSTRMQDRLDRRMLLGLIVLAWTGLFACIRAILLDNGSAWTSGIAACGLISAATLVSLALLGRLQASTPGSHATVVVVFLLPPVLLLVL